MHARKPKYILALAGQHMVDGEKKGKKNVLMNKKLLVEIEK
jgi:hypothetical protein